MSEFRCNWKDFIIQVATVDDAAAVCENVCRYFLHEEILNSYLGYSEANAVDHCRMIESVLRHGVSLVARHRDTAEVAGVHLVMDRRLPTSFQSTENLTSPDLAKIFCCISRVINEANEIFQREFPCPFYAEIFVTSIAPNFRKLGLAKELYRQMILLLGKNGFPVVRSTFTSSITRNIAKSLGFIEMHRIYFKDQLDEAGNKLFQLAGNGVEEFINDTARFL